MDSIISGKLLLPISDVDKEFISKLMGNTSSGGTRKPKEKAGLERNLKEIFKKFPLFDKLPQLLIKYLQVGEKQLCTRRFLWRYI